MSQLTWLGLGAAALLLVATLVGARLIARRAAGPLEIQLTGEVPPIPDLLPGALHEFAGGSPGGTARFSDEVEDQILRGHRGEVNLPATGVELGLRTQPHLVLTTRTTAHPLVIIVELVAAPTRSGLPRLLFGSTPTPAALQLRSQLVQAVVRAARNHGLSVKASSPQSAAGLAAAGLALAVMALVVALITPAQRIVADIGAQSSPSPTPWYPAGASACPGPAKKPAQPPTRSAVAKGTSCSFAESVRAAYAKAKIKGKSVRLGKVRYDKKTVITMTCTVAGPYVTCRGGKKEVYLS